MRYPAFEASFRATATRLGVHATSHMFRHTVAQLLVDTAGLHVAQQILGHRNVSTTADVYAYVDEKAMLKALVESRSPSAERAPDCCGRNPDVGMRDYAPETIAALDDLGGCR